MKERGLRRAALTWAAVGAFVIVAIDCNHFFTDDPVHVNHLVSGTIAMVAFVLATMWPGRWVNGLVFAIALVAAVDAWLQVIGSYDIWALSPSLDLGTVVLTTLIIPIAGVQSRAWRVVGPLLIGATAVAAARFDGDAPAAAIGGPLALILVSWVCMESIIRLEAASRVRMKMLAGQARIDRAVATTVRALYGSESDRLNKAMDLVRLDLDLEAVFLARRIGPTGLLVEAAAGDQAMVPSAGRFPAEWVGWFQRSKGTTSRLGGKPAVIHPILQDQTWVACCGFVGEESSRLQDVTKAVTDIIGADLMLRRDAEKLESELRSRDMLLFKAGEDLSGPLEALKTKMLNENPAEGMPGSGSRGSDGTLGRVVEILDDLIVVGRLRDENLGAASSRFDLGQACRDTLASDRVIERSKGKSIVPTLAAVEIWSDETRTKQALRNLIVEALGNAAETVRVVTAVVAGDAVARIMDDGPEKHGNGSPEDPDVGVLICHEITRYLGGEVIRRRAGGWNVLELRLPRTDQAS